MSMATSRTMLYSSSMNFRWRLMNVIFRERSITTTLYIIPGARNALSMNYN
jgi:hypothetical protein